MDKPAAKPAQDHVLTEALKGTFPASDPVASSTPETTPVRPVGREPAPIDKALVEKLAKQTEKKG